MIILGTAGHIDHGKTTLIRSLTGIDTDRLKEEKERGISIELGFAWLDLPNGQRAGVVDVPGHEKFVRQMIAGAVGVDVVLLVIAADEGVMPQTREHLDICRLLGVRHGVVVLTKVDLVDEEWLLLVEDDVQTFVAGTFLEGSPILRFSAVDPGLAASFGATLRQLLVDLFPRAPRRDLTQPFKLPVDRVFTVRGFGTVVTGTVQSGQVALGEEVLLLPEALQGRVRGIEVHGAGAERVGAGSRAAINVQGVEKSEAHRGSVLIRAGELEPTSMFDASLRVLPNLGRPLGQRSKALVHTGTSQILATVVLLDRAEVEPGGEALVQIRLDSPVVVLPGDPFILRGFEVLANYGKTEGGGRVLDPHPRKHRTTEADTVATLRALRDGDDGTRAEALLRAAGESGLSQRWLRRRLRVDDLPGILEGLRAQGRAVATDADDPTWVHAEPWERLVDQVLRLLRSFHDRNPARPGISREELRTRLRGGLDTRLFGHLIQSLERKGRVVSDADAVRLHSFQPKVTGQLQKVRDALLAHFEAARLEPPTPQEAGAALGFTEAIVREALDALVREGALVRVRTDLLFARPAMDALRAQLVAFLEREGEITTPQFKEMTGSSRKYTIPLGEYFDAEKVTLRVGEVRRLRRKG
ncbi:MAG: selenocysteine-specific translation elongation factor [Myxococcales bacterium]